MTKPRARDLGIPFEGATGELNAITDIFGVSVGYATIMAGDSARTGVTILQVGPCVIVDKRTPARDGYAALVLGLRPYKGDPRRVERLVGKPMMGRFKKLNVRSMASCGLN